MKENSKSYGWISRNLREKKFQGFGALEIDEHGKCNLRQFSSYLFCNYPTLMANSSYALLKFPEFPSSIHMVINHVIHI